MQTKTQRYQIPMFDLLVSRESRIHGVDNIAAIIHVGGLLLYKTISIIFNIEVPKKV
jgi:hypothetical protein